MIHSSQPFKVAASSGLVLFVKPVLYSSLTSAVGVTFVYVTMQPLPLCQNILNIAMPTSDVLLHHFRRMLLRARIDRWMSLAGPTVCELRQEIPLHFWTSRFKLLESTVDNVPLHT